MELFNFRNGKLEKIKQAPALEIGTKVMIYGGAMAETIGAIIGEERGMYKIVNLSDYNAGFNRTEKAYIRPLSEKFGIGTYYFDNLEKATPEEIADFVAKAEKAEADEKEAAIAQDLADKKEIAELPSIYPHLAPISNEWGHKRAETKKNVVAELKKNFPKVKFSVKSDYSSINIRWINGPTAEQVDKIVDKFEDHKRSDCGDYRDLSQSNFNKVFGGFNYVFTNREMSPEIKVLLPQVKSLMIECNNFHQYPDQVLYEIFAKTEIAQNEKAFEFLRESDLNADHFYKIVSVVKDSEESDMAEGNQPFQD